MAAIRALEEKHWTPTRSQKIIASIDGFFGKLMNNQARILESRTTRAGIPYGPGGPVTPPASFFKSQPPNIGRSDYAAANAGNGGLSTASSRTATSGVEGLGVGAKSGESKHVHGAETGVGGGHHGGMEGTGHGRQRSKISGQ